MRVLVVTAVHRGDDARVYQRQIRQIVAAGHEVVYVAPQFTAGGAKPFHGVTHVEVPRAAGRHRLRSWRAVRAAAKQLRTSCDIMIVHDLELTAVLSGTGHGPAVYDVKEDTAAAIGDKRWVPTWAHPVVRWITTALERRAAGHYHLVLAEYGYRERLGDHPVVQNSTWIPAVTPAPAGDQVVYVGRISTGRGAATLLEVGAMLQRDRLLLVGDADDDVREAVAEAAAAGTIRWTGFLPNPDALVLVEGALAGLSLLREQPNYVQSQPTKIIEYLARGVPAITSPLPLAKALIERTGAGFVVPYDDAGAVVEAIRALDADPALRASMGAAGFAAASAEFDWKRDGAEFVGLLETWVSSPGPVRRVPERRR